MCSRFPTVMISIISLPFDQVLILIVVLVTVENTLNFIFKVVVDFDGWRWK